MSPPQKFFLTNSAFCAFPCSFYVVLISEIHRMDAENDLFGMEHSRLSFFMTDL